MAYISAYSWPPATLDSQVWIENSISIYRKNSTYKWTHAIQTCVVQASTTFKFPVLVGIALQVLRYIMVEIEN